MRMICPDSESIIYDRHSSDILRCLPSCNARWRLIACLSLVPCGALPSHQRVKFSKQKKGWAVMPSYMLRYMLARKQMKPEPPWTSNVGVGMDHWDVLRLSQYIPVTSHDVQWCSTECHDADAALQLISGPRFDREVRAAQTLALHSWRCGLDLVRFRNGSSEPKPVLWSDCDKLQHTIHSIHLNSLHRKSERRQSPLRCQDVSGESSFHVIP